MEFADTDIPDGFRAGNFTYKGNGARYRTCSGWIRFSDTVERDRRMASVTSKINQLWKRRMIVILMPSWSNSSDLREVRTKLRAKSDLTGAPDIDCRAGGTGCGEASGFLRILLAALDCSVVPASVDYGSASRLDNGAYLSPVTQ